MQTVTGGAVPKLYCARGTSITTAKAPGKAAIDSSSTKLREHSI